MCLFYGMERKGVFLLSDLVKGGLHRKIRHLSIIMYCDVVTKFFDISHTMYWDSFDFVLYSFITLVLLILWQWHLYFWNCENPALFWHTIHLTKSTEKTSLNRETRMRISFRIISHQLQVRIFFGSLTTGNVKKSFWPMTSQKYLVL